MFRVFRVRPSFCWCPHLCTCCFFESECPFSLRSIQFSLCLWFLASYLWCAGCGFLCLFPTLVLFDSFWSITVFYWSSLIWRWLEKHVLKKFQKDYGTSRKVLCSEYWWLLSLKKWRPNLGQSWCQLNHAFMALAMDTCRMGHDKVSILENS